MIYRPPQVEIVDLTFAPHASKMRISSSGCIVMMASASARCSGFGAHSVGML